MENIEMEIDTYETSQLNDQMTIEKYLGIVIPYTRIDACLDVELLSNLFEFQKKIH